MAQVLDIIQQILWFSHNQIHGWKQHIFEVFWKTKVLEMQKS